MCPSVHLYARVITHRWAACSPLSTTHYGEGGVQELERYPVFLRGKKNTSAREVYPIDRTPRDWDTQDFTCVYRDSEIQTGSGPSWARVNEMGHGWPGGSRQRKGKAE